MATAKIDVKTDLHKSDKELNKVEKSLKGVDTQAEKADKTSKGLWKQFAIGALAAEGLKQGFKVLAGFVKDSIANAIEQERVEKALEAVLKSTKNAVGLSKDELLKMAVALQKTTTFGDEAVIGAENLLLTFTNIGRKVFPDALETVLDMSTALGQDLKSSAIQLGKALNDPILGVTALARVGVNFNEVQKEMIRNLVESGDVVGAQTLILEELKLEFGGASTAAADTFGGALQQLGNAWSDLQEKVGEFVTTNEDFKQIIDDLIEKVGELGSEENIGQVGAGLLGIIEIIETGKGAWNFLTDKTGLAQDLMGGLTGDMALAKAEFALLAIDTIAAGDAASQFDNKAEMLTEQLALMRGEITEADLKFGIIHPKITSTTESIDTLVPATKGMTVAWKDYKFVAVDVMGIIDKAPGQVDDLAFSISEITGTIDTAVPPANDLGTAFDDMLPENLETDIGEVEDAMDLLSDEMALLATDIGTAFGDLFIDIVDASTTFEEDMIAFWENIKKAFILMIADMIAAWVTDFVAEFLLSTKDVEGAIGGIGDAAEGAAGQAEGLINALAGAGGSGGLVGAFSAVAFSIVFLGGLFDLLFNTFDSLNEHWEEQRKAMLDQRDRWIELGMSIRDANDKIREFIRLREEANRSPELDPERGKPRFGGPPGSGGPRPGEGRPGGPLNPGIGGSGGFADGGIAWNEQITRVAEKGPEAMIPLDQLLDAISGNDRDRNISITLQIDGQTLAEVLSPHIAEQARLGNLPFEQQNFTRSET